MARTKPYFRVHLSIAGHRNTAVIWSNIIDRAIYAELGRLAMVKYAPKTDDTFYLSTKELMAITCTSNAGAAGVRWRAFLEHCRAGAESLGGQSPVTAESLESHSEATGRPLGSHWRVTVRNLAEKHGMSEKKDKEGPPKKKREEEERRGKKKSKEPAPPSEDAIACAELLRAHIRTLQPNRKLKPNFVEKSSETYDKMLRLDSRAFPEVLSQLTWLFGPNQDAEARFEVFSAKAHREKFDPIDRMMYRARTNPDAAAKARGDAVRAARERREAAEHAQRETDRDNTASPDEMRAAVKASREKRGEGVLSRVILEVS